jgi:hypothetical protein
LYAHCRLGILLLIESIHVALLPFLALNRVDSYNEEVSLEDQYRCPKDYLQKHYNLFTGIESNKMLIWMAKS